MCPETPPVVHPPVMIRPLSAVKAYTGQRTSHLDRAQGFNVSMEDSRQLIDCLVRIERGEDCQAVMGEYDKDVCERGRAVVLASLEEGKRKMNLDLVMTSKTATQGFAKPGPQIVKLSASS
jgi:2-polyprenyl-6-methoxyphenol hydroxylase-like FAD-dependent oxidoreductase